MYASTSSLPRPVAELVRMHAGMSSHSLLISDSKACAVKHQHSAYLSGHRAHQGQIYRQLQSRHGKGKHADSSRGKGGGRGCAWLALMLSSTPARLSHFVNRTAVGTCRASKCQTESSRKILTTELGTRNIFLKL